MKKQIKLWQSAMAIWAVLLVLRAGFFIEAFRAIPSLFLNSRENTDFGIIPELIIYFIFPIIIWFSRKKFDFTLQKVRFYQLFCLLLVYLFLFAGIIADENPDFQKNLSVTKFLPPLSTVNVLHLKNGDFDGNVLSKKSFDESIIFIDSIRSEGNSWVYYQKQKSFEIPENRLLFSSGKPVVTEKTFILGSDALGQDVFVRLIYSVRTSLIIGISAALISFLTGILTGFIAGYYEGFPGMILSRTVDVLLSFPVMLLIILVVAMFGSSFAALILILGFTGWMGLFKIIKSELSLLKTKDYFITSKLMGLSSSQLIVKDALPVFIIPALTNLIFQINNVILAESALSYLGLGAGNMYPSWGAMIQSGQEYMSQAWWLVFFPGAMIIFTLQSLRSFGNSINRYFNPGLTK